MPEKIERIMKKIHIYLANCRESAYSSEDVVVSKKRMIDMLNELNMAVYEVMEEYEATVTSRELGQAEAERSAAAIKADAMSRAEDIYASSLLYTQRAISDMQNIFGEAFKNMENKYGEFKNEFEKQMKQLSDNSEEMSDQLEVMNGSKTYLRIIEDIKSESKEKTNAIMNKQGKKPNTKKVGSALVSEMGLDDSEVEDDTEYLRDEYSLKMSTAAVVEVHDVPRVPEGFKKQSKKNKKTRNTSGDARALENQTLDAEYFAFRVENDKDEDENEGENE